jgi:hypothetical protein
VAPRAWEGDVTISGIAENCPMDPQGLTTECVAGSHGSCGLLVDLTPGFPSRCICLCHTQAYIDALRKHAEDRRLFTRTGGASSADTAPVAGGRSPAGAESVTPASATVSSWSPSSQQIAEEGGWSGPWDKL